MNLTERIKDTLNRAQSLNALADDMLAALAEVETLRAERDRYRHEAAAAGKTCAELAERLAQATADKPQREGVWLDDDTQLIVASGERSIAASAQIVRKDGTNGAVYTIFVSRETRTARVEKDGRVIFRIVGDVAPSTVFGLAVSALKRFVKHCAATSHAARRERRKRKEAANGMA